MNIKEFEEGFNKARDKQNFVNEHIVTRYLPFEQKVAIANATVKTTCNKPNGDFIRNTPAIYMNYITTLIREYTDIEYDKKDILNVLNIVEKNDITETLIDAIGNDAKRLDTVIKMVIDDAIDNHNDLINFITLKSDNLDIIMDKLKVAVNGLQLNNKQV